MSRLSIQELKHRVETALGDQVASLTENLGELTLVVEPEQLLAVCQRLRDDEDLAFAMLIDLCGVDYLDYGRGEWETTGATREGFSRGVDPTTSARLGMRLEDLSTEQPVARGRFAAVYHLLSLQHDQRLRLRCFVPDDDLPVLPSVTGIWNSANWYEREAFDLYGIIFEGHPDLRRLLTDYGFVGHPFRKDFPLIGNVEVRYDPERQRVVYQPVTIEPRVLVPKVVRRHGGRHA